MFISRVHTDFHGSQAGLQRGRLGRHGRALVLMAMSVTAAWRRSERVHHPCVENRVDKDEDGHEHETGE